MPEMRTYMKKITISFLLLFASSFSAIASDVIIPLKIGNYWKFISNKGQIEYARVLEKVDIDGKKWFKYRELSDENIFYINNSTNGQVEIDIESSEKNLVLKYPVEKDTIYLQFNNKTLVMPNIKVTVPAGTFNAYLYNFSIENPESPILVWIVPGLGPVKSVYENTIYKLVEFSVQ